MKTFKKGALWLPAASGQPQSPLFLGFHWEEFLFPKTV